MASSARASALISSRIAGPVLCLPAGLLLTIVGSFVLHPLVMLGCLMQGMHAAVDLVLALARLNARIPNDVRADPYALMLLAAAPAFLAAARLGAALSAGAGAAFCPPRSRARAAALGAAVGTMAGLSLADAVAHTPAAAAAAAGTIASSSIKHATWTGSVLGIVLNLLLFLLPVAALAATFALVFVIVPDEASIYVSSYAGSYLLWRGLALWDTDSFTSSDDYAIPAFVELDSVDMWFNVLSFLLVGLIGVCIQLILHRNYHRYPTLQDSYEYQQIP